jgi:hypothetical protein
MRKATWSCFCLGLLTQRSPPWLTYVPPKKSKQPKQNGLEVWLRALKKMAISTPAALFTSLSHLPLAENTLTLRNLRKSRNPNYLIS